MIQEIKSVNITQSLHQNFEESTKLNVETKDTERSSEKGESLSIEDIENVIKEMNRFVQIFNTKISFEIDKDTRKTILKIVDAQTNEIIRQIPPEELLEISRRISELLGLIINEKV
jgi:flagellar protein FlaG